jgi:hypothetical protein
MANDVSVHDLAADGSVMTSKIEAGNGSVAIQTQQTSEFHHWMIKAYQYVTGAPAREWARFGIICVAPDMMATHEGSYMSIQKRADKPYQQQGQQVTWTFLCGKLVERL